MDLDNDTQASAEEAELIVAANAAKAFHFALFHLTLSEALATDNNELIQAAAARQLQSVYRMMVARRIVTRKAVGSVMEQMIVSLERAAAYACMLERITDPVCVCACVCACVCVCFAMTTWRMPACWRGPDTW